MIKLSIIIPIYKVEKYIVECIESICCQLIDDVEVILVNDGTPDRSMEIAKDYIRNKYSQHLTQFVFVDQKNQGLSGARNTGISTAKGEYVAFLDSDDKLNVNYFEKIMEIINIEKAIDIIQFSALRFNCSGSVSSFLKPFGYEGKHLLDDNIYKFIFSNSAWFAWLRVYKKSLFNEHEFPVGRNYEDAYLIPKIFIISKYIYFLNEQLICYRENLQGISCTFSHKNINDLQWVVIDMLKNLNTEIRFYQYSILPISKHLLNVSYNNEKFIIFLGRIRILKRVFKESCLIDNSGLNLKDKFFYYFPLIFILLLSLKS